ncbi:MAG: tyrosine-type recombinase/integrase [Chloroflexota bacterium]
MKAYLEPEEVGLLERATTNLRDRLLIRLLFRAGMRVSEAVSLAVPDVDLEAGTVRILHLKERLRLFCPSCGVRLGRSHRFCPGCGKEVPEPVRRLQETRRQRLLPLDGETLGLIGEFMARGGPVNHRLFSIGRGQAWRVVSEAARRAGLGPLVHPESGRTHGVSPHRLRDAFAVHALRRDSSGEGMRLLQEHLGHTSFNTTARYRKVSGVEQREWYEGLWEGKG